jgi:hypothetical protein
VTAPAPVAAGDSGGSHSSAGYVMGRVTYEAMAAMSVAADDPATTRMTAKPKAVVSNTLREPLTWPNTRLIAGDAVFPLVLGPDGREPWYAGYQRAALDLLTTSVLDDRIVLLEYERAG